MSSLVIGHTNVLQQSRLRKKGLKSDYEWKTSSPTELSIGIYLENFFQVGLILRAINKTQPVDNFSLRPVSNIMDRWIRYYHDLQKSGDELEIGRADV